MKIQYKIENDTLKVTYKDCYIEHKLKVNLFDSHLLTLAEFEIKRKYPECTLANKELMDEWTKVAEYLGNRGRIKEFLILSKVPLTFTCEEMYISYKTDYEKYCEEFKEKSKYPEIQEKIDLLLSVSKKDMEDNSPQKS